MRLSRTTRLHCGRRESVGRDEPGSDMKATVPQTNIATVGVQRIDVGEIDAGPISIGKLTLDSIHVGVSTGSVKARNVEVTVSVKIELDWWVGVTVDDLGNWGWNGSIPLGTQSATIRLGDLNLSGLQSLDLDVATLGVSNVSAVVAPIRDLRLGPLVTEQIAAQGLVLPEPDFMLTGLGLASAVIDGISVPAASAEQATVGHAHGDALPLGTITIPGLSLPRASVGDIASDDLTAGGEADPYVLTADAGVFGGTLTVTPSASVTMDELRISNVRATASVGSVTLQNVVLPYDVFDITLSELGIHTIAVPTVEVS